MFDFFTFLKLSQFLFLLRETYVALFRLLYIDDVAFNYPGPM